MHYAPDLYVCMYNNSSRLSKPEPPIVARPMQEKVSRKVTQTGSRSLSPAETMSGSPAEVRHVVQMANVTALCILFFPTMTIHRYKRQWQLYEHFGSSEAWIVWISPSSAGKCGAAFHVQRLTLRTRTRYTTMSPGYLDWSQPVKWWSSRGQSSSCTFRAGVWVCGWSWSCTRSWEIDGCGKW